MARKIVMLKIGQVLDRNRDGVVDHDEVKRHIDGYAGEARDGKLSRKEKDLFTREARARGATDEQIERLIRLAENPRGKPVGSMSLLEVRAAAAARARGVDAPLGTLDSPILDSNTTWAAERALTKAVFPELEGNILEALTLVTVQYVGEDGRVHQGQIVIDRRLAADLEQVFAVALREKCPIAAAVPISQYGFDDPDSMEANNTSAFCFRAKTGGGGFSKHAYGLAVDINPLHNPYWSPSRKLLLPANARPYDPTRPGTLTPDSPIVQTFKALGWTWGGDWSDPKDWQHFEKEPA